MIRIRMRPTSRRNGVYVHSKTLFDGLMSLALKARRANTHGSSDGSAFPFLAVAMLYGGGSRSQTRRPDGCSFNLVHIACRRSRGGFKKEKRKRKEYIVAPAVMLCLGDCFRINPPS
jgi:hypothetical protein